MAHLIFCETCQVCCILSELESASTIRLFVGLLSIISVFRLLFVTVMFSVHSGPMCAKGALEQARSVFWLDSVKSNLNQTLVSLDSVLLMLVLVVCINCCVSFYRASAY